MRFAVRFSRTALRTASRAAVPVALVLLTRCSVVSDLDSLGNGPPDAAPDTSTNTEPDTGANPTPDSSSPVDSSGGDEGDASDTSTPIPDAAPDVFDAAPTQAAPTYLDAGSTTWCSSQTGATFCADFDESPLPAGFPSSDGSFLSLTSSTASSSPNDLMLWVPEQNGTSTFSSKLSRNFTEHASTLTALFDLDPERLNTTTSGVLFFALDFLGAATAKYSLRLAFNGGASRLEESFLGSAQDLYHPTFNLVVGAWSHIKLVLSFGPDGGTSTASLFVNDTLQGIVETLNPPTGFDTRPSLLVGAVYGTMPHTGWVLRYDNVAVTIQ